MVTLSPSDKNNNKKVIPQTAITTISRSKREYFRLQYMKKKLSIHSVKNIHVIRQLFRECFKQLIISLPSMSISKRIGTKTSLMWAFSWTEAGSVSSKQSGNVRTFLLTTRFLKWKTFVKLRWDNLSPQSYARSEHT